MLLQVLEERGFPNSCITSLSPRGDAPAAAAAADLVFMAAPAEVSREYAPRLVEAGCIVIDLSAAWRLEAGVPLVIPEVNADDLNSHRGIISCPNCTNVPLAMALAAIQGEVEVEQVVVTTMQASSGGGRAGLESLQGGQSPFGHQLLGNVIPQCDEIEASGDSAEETRLVVETQRLLKNPDLAIAATCLRVPVDVGHSLSVHLRTSAPVSTTEAIALLASMPGLQVHSGNDYPTAIDVAGSDEVHVGRLRTGHADNELQMWVVCDNLRKGAATNAVQVAELLF